MQRLLLSALCTVAALSLFTPNSPAQAPANNGTGTASSSDPGSGTGTAGSGKRRGGGEALEEKHARQIISKYDKDGDHALNATELAAFFDALHQRVAERSSPSASGSSSSPSTTPRPSARKGKQAAGTSQDRAAKAIEKFDKNNDGKLDAAEVAALLRAIRERLMQDRDGRPSPGAATTGAPNA